MIHATTSNALFDHAPTLLATLSPDGVLLDLNARWEGMFGYSRSELRSHFLAEFVSQADKLPLQSALRTIITTHRVTLETTFRSKYGVTHTLTWTMEWGGADAIIYAHVTPVESQKETSTTPNAYQTFLDQTGFEIEEVLSLVLNYDKILYTVLNPDGSIHYESHVTSSFFGRDAADYKGQALLSYVHPSDRGMWVSYFQSTMSKCGTAQPHMMHYRRRHLNGSWLHIRSHIVPMKRTDEMCGFVVISADLSDHHNAMRATQETIEELEQQIQGLTKTGVQRETPRSLRSINNSIHRNLSEHLPMALLMFDQDQTDELSVCWTNRRAAHWLAQDSQTLNDITIQSWGPSFEQACKEVVGTKQTLVTTLINAQDQVYDALIFGVEGSGVGVAFQTNAQLVLQEHTHHSQLELISNKSDALLHNQPAYTFDWSHELRTPLHTILGYTELLQEDEQANVTMAQDLSIVHHSARYMATLIANMAAMQQLKKGRTDILLDFVSVDAFIENLQRNLPSIQALRAPELEHVHMYVDQNKFEQVMLNTFYFMRHYAADDAPTWSMKIKQGRVLFSCHVARTRPIPSYLQSLLRLEPIEGAQPQIGGMTLGMSVAQEWIKLMGGDLTMELDAPGATITLNIPMPQWEYVENSRADKVGFELISEELAEAQSGSVMEHTHASVVLLIDDDPVTHDIMKRFSRDKPYHIISAFDATRGLEVARRLHPTCIIIDVMMSNADGWTLLNQLRTDKALEDIPVIIHSLLNEPELYESMGGFTHLSKPLQRSSLDDVLAAHHWPHRCVVLTNAQDSEEAVPWSHERSYPIDHWLHTQSTSQTLELLRLHRPEVILWDTQVAHTSLEMLFSSLMHFDMANCACFVLKKTQHSMPSLLPKGFKVTQWNVDDVREMESLNQAWEQALRDARSRR